MRQPMAVFCMTAIVRARAKIGNKIFCGVTFAQHMTPAYQHTQPGTVILVAIGCSLADTPLPQRGCISKPKLAAQRLPWEMSKHFANPDGVAASRRTTNAATPLGLF